MSETDFAGVLNHELDLITVRREEIRKRAPQATPPVADVPALGGDQGPTPADAKGSAPREQKRARLDALQRHVTGLALSGGGIRSATFALGVLQGLADLRILSRFDYLSTVSGGGYIGTWLAAWIKREGDPLAVERQLSPSRVAEADVARREIGTKIVDEEPEPVHHLRSYSNYLTPRPGILSVDFWTVLTIYVRNALINMLLLLPLTVLLVLLGRWVVWFYALPVSSNATRVTVLVAFAVSFVLAILSLGLHVGSIQGAAQADDGKVAPDPWWSPARWSLNLTVIWPLVLAAVLAGWTFSIPPAAGVVTAARPSLPEDRFRIRLPDGNHGVEGFQPHVDFSTFRFLESLPHFNDSAYKMWHDRREFLWPSALEFAIAFGLVGAVVHTLGYLFLWWKGIDPDTLARRRGEDRNRIASASYLAFSAGIASFTGGALFLAAVSEVLWRWYHRPDLVATVGPPLLLVVFIVATFIEVWLLGRWQGDDLREWWARVCAWLAIYALAWLAFFGLTLYGPMLVDYLLAQTWARSGATLAWLSTAAGGALAGRSPASRPGGDWRLRILVSLAPTVFVAGLLVIVASFVNVLVFDAPTARVMTVRRLLDPTAPVQPRIVQADGTPVLSKSEQELLAMMQSGSLRASWSGLVTTRPWTIFAVQTVALVLAALASIMSNVNLFSLNAMYASRLTRCYLGASRPKRAWAERGSSWRPGPGGAPTGTGGPVRRENPFTGFDPRDDIPLWRMRIGEVLPDRKTPHDPEGGYLGPQLLINTSLNLVAGEELAWQDRKAESFVLSATHCGSKSTGYAATTLESGRELSLGRAMSISGAAVDSNIGVHQSSALIALMTAFNARLGWWMLNPNPKSWLRRGWPFSRGRAAWDAASPSLALPLVLELFGQTDAKKKWIHLSDGGHFENLGVYELVRRRCRYIVCCDAGTDPQAADDNLANMIHLCRTDFGVRIDLDTTNFARPEPEKLSRWHCAVGKIRYDDVDRGELPGIFVYLRTSLTGDEPPDVQEYAAKNPDFPWQSTLDQFFDERQFESYRALGFHIAQTAFKDALAEVDDTEPLWSNQSAELEFRRGNQRVFSAVQRRWAPTPSHQNATFLQAARGWTEFQHDLLTRTELAALGAQIYPERAALSKGDPEIHAVAQMIQVMENAWVDLRLGGFRDLPMNRGWMTVFRRWAATPDFRRLWPTLRGEFSQDFIRFCETHLALAHRVEAVESAMLDEPFRREAIAALAAEFALEWPLLPPLESLIDQATATWSSRAQPAPMWLILVAPPGPRSILENPDKLACGILFASVLGWVPLGSVLGGASEEAGERGIGEHFEIFAWFRRPYRGMGIASRCAKTILMDFRRVAHRGHREAIMVSTQYPVEGAAHGESMEYVLWRNFFSHYDFQPPRDERGLQDDFYVLRRIFHPAEPEL